MSVLPASLDGLFAPVQAGVRAARSAPRWGWGLWVAGLLTMDALGMGYLVVPGAWLVRLVMMIVATAVVGVLLRHVMQQTSRNLQAAAVFFVIVLLAAGGVVHEAASDEMAVGLIPTLAAIRQTTTVLTQSLSSIVQAVPPVAEVWVFAPFVFLAMGLLTAIVVTAGVVWRDSIVVMVATLAPWAVIFSMRIDASWIMPLLMGVGSLAFALWEGLVRRPSAVRQKVEGGRVVSAGFVMMTAVVAAVVAGLVAPSISSWGSGLMWLRSFNGNGSGKDGSIGISGSLNVNGWLQSGDSTVVMTVTGDYNGPLQVTTMTNFDGQTWLPASPSDAQYAAYGDIIWPPGDPAWASVYPTTANTVVDFSTWNDYAVPIGVGPRSLRFDYGNLSYYPFTDSVTSDVELSNLHITESIGLIDRSTLPDDTAAQAKAGELDVPSTSHTGDLEMLVAALISGISDDYDKLMAIENYLTSSNFTYTLTPSRTSPSDDAVWDFLQRRTGYCVHFATAMVMLGRLAGIPMRVALGFTLPANGNGVVRNLNAHVWPQAHFQNAGWVSFEPTPGGPGTAVPQESMSPSSAQPSTSAPSTSTPTTTASSSSTAAPSTSASTAPGGTAGGGLPWQWILLGVAAAFIVVMAVWGVRAWRIGRATPERAWAAIMRVAQKRQLIDIGATPRAVIDDVGPSLGDDTLARLTALAEEIEKRRYAPPGDAPSKTHPRQWHKAQTSVLRDLKRHQHEA